MYFGVVNTFLGALMPAISESYGNKRQKLTEYYLIEGIKWSYYFTFFLTAVLLATGNSIIVLAGTQWSPALKVRCNLHRLLRLFGRWLGMLIRSFKEQDIQDGILLYGSLNKALALDYSFTHYQDLGLLVYFMHISPELSQRILILIIIRKEGHGISALLESYFISLAVSGFILYLILEQFEIWNVSGNPGFSILILGVGFFGGLLFYSFITGFIGGWDENTLMEFEEGVSMIRSTRKMFLIYQRAAKLGYQLSPWKARFTIDVFNEAKQEAESLTLEKESAMKDEI